MLTNKKPTTGECEYCGQTDTAITVVRGDNMCDACVAKEATVTSMVKESRKIDSAIVLKTDVFIARTVAATELRAAIEHDDNIPADQKDYAFAVECMSRFKHLQKVIFDRREALLQDENEARMWQVNVQSTAGKLHADLQKQFRELDVTYQPTPITKKQKSTKPVKTAKAFSKQELADACKKYNVTQFQVNVRMMMVSRNGLSADAAAREFAQKMGLL